MATDANGLPIVGTPEPAVPSGATEESTQGATVPAGSGEIDPPVADEEASFVDSAWDALDGNFVSDKDLELEAPEESSAAEQAEVKEPVQQVPTPQEATPQPQAQQPAQLTPEQAVQQVAQPVAPPQAQQAPADQGQQPPVVAGPNKDALQALQQEVAGVREQFIKENGEALYNTFSDEEKEVLGEDQAKLLSQMGARLHHDIVSNTLAMVAAKAPEMVMGLMTAQRENDAKKEAFFTEYPHLRGQDQALLQIAPIVKQQFPKADAKEFGQKLAAAAQLMLGLAPTQAPVTRPTQPTRQPAFQPAAGRGPTQAPIVAKVPPGATDWGSYDEILQAEQEGRLNGL